MYGKDTGQNHQRTQGYSSHVNAIGRSAIDHKVLLTRGHIDSILHNPRRRHGARHLPLRTVGLVENATEIFFVRDNSGNAFELIQYKQ
jgi:hypothetical protein